MDDEKRRIDEVRRYLQLDFKSSEFQDIVDLAAQLCDKPVALITLLDEDVNWLKVRSGVDVEVMPRETSFCQYGIQQDQLLIIPDATKDERFDGNPLVKSDPNLRFYAGAPLILDNGLKLGTLCLFDVKPNSITELQQKTLVVLSRQVTFLMELEMNQRLLQAQVKEIEAKNESLRKIGHMQSHEIRQPLTSIIGLVNLVKEGLNEVDEDWLNMMMEATGILDKRIRAIVTESMGSKETKATRFHRMVEEIKDYAILLLDREGNIESWNNGAEQLKGYIAGEIIGKNFNVFYTEEERAKGRPNELIEQAIETGFAKDQGWRVRKDGSKFWASVVITAIHNNDNEVIGFTKITRDISDPERV